jgi:hypothetical protein
MANKYLEKLAFMRPSTVEKLAPYVLGGATGSLVGTTLSDKDSQGRKNLGGILAGAALGGLAGHSAVKAYRMGAARKIMRHADFSKMNLDKVKERAYIARQVGSIAGGAAGAITVSKLVDKADKQKQKSDLALLRAAKK